MSTQRNKGIIIILGLSLSILFFTGCATMPTQKELTNLDYGIPLTIDYKTVIKNYFEKVLFDPYSVHYRFGIPQRYWYREAPLFGGKLHSGYMVFVGVNAKNRMGGYTGMKEHGFLFKNNQIIKILQPEEISLMKSR